MDRIRTILEMTLRWVDGADPVPLAYAAEDSIPVHTRPRPLLEFGLHTGGSESTLNVPGIQCSSKPGTLAILNAHFGNQGTPRREWSFWCVSLTTDTCPDQYLTSEPFLETVVLQHMTRVRTQFEELGRQYQRQGPTQPYRVKAEMLRLLLTLMEATGCADTEPVYSPACEAALAYIDDHLTDPTLDLGRIASAACLSASQLCRVFNADLGTSPMKAVTAKRLSRAKDLLHRTALNISEISAAVGFNDPLHFSRLFRRDTGTPPRVFRRRNDL